MTLLDDAPARHGVELPADNQPDAPAPCNGAPVPTRQPEAPAPAMPAGGQQAAMSAEPSAPDHARRHALWFFWMWLLFATVVSIGGNVIHAWMTAPASHLKLLAAVAAAVPPAVLLGSTHSVALLIKTRRRGYRRIDAWVLGGALALTIGVAGCAFAMSFFALRDLMVLLGMSGDTAWLWPIAVDLSLICSTLALLSLTSPDSESRTGREHRAAAAAAIAADPAAVTVVNTGPASPAERRVWWESIAAVVREQMAGVPKIAALTNGQLGEILQRMYDQGESARTIVDSTPLHNREVKPMKEIVDGVLARTAPRPLNVVGGQGND